MNSSKAFFLALTIFVLLFSTYAFGWGAPTISNLSVEAAGSCPTTATIKWEAKDGDIDKCEEDWYAAISGGICPVPPPASCDQFYLAGPACFIQSGSCSGACSYCFNCSAINNFWYEPTTELLYRLDYSYCLDSPIPADPASCVSWSSWLPITPGFLIGDTQQNQYFPFPQQTGGTEAQRYFSWNLKPSTTTCTAILQQDLTGGLNGGADNKSFPVFNSTNGYKGTSDTMIVSNQASTNFGSATTLEVGKNNAPNEYKYLVNFDLSLIPPASIQNASLHLFYYWSSVFTGDPNNNANIYEISSPWAASTVTWNTAPTMTPTLSPSVELRQRWQATRNNQRFMEWGVPVPISTNGWAIVSDTINTSTATDKYDFYSSENSYYFYPSDPTKYDQTVRPELIINYSPTSGDCPQNSPTSKGFTIKQGLVDLSGNYLQETGEKKGYYKVRLGIWETAHKTTYLESVPYAIDCSAPPPAATFRIRDLKVIPALVPNDGEISVEAVIVNDSALTIPARDIAVSLSSSDTALNALLFSVASKKNESELAPGQTETIKFGVSPDPLIDLGSMPSLLGNGVYSVTATGVSASSSATKTAVFNVANISQRSIPELSLLFVPVVIGAVLLIVFFSRKRKNN